MDAFAFMLKTYSKDIPYVKKLLDSFKKYNIGNIPLYIVIDRNEHNGIVNELGENDNVSIIEKEDIDVEYTRSEINGISAGYINQEIVKLSFWKTGLCRNYSCIDSELEFIRPFFVDEFMYDKEIPYTVLIEDKDLNINPNYYNNFWVHRQKKLDTIKDTLGIKGSHIMTCHGMQTFNAKVLLHMEENFMKPNGYSYLDLIRLSPYEFSWYNYYLQKETPIPIHPCEPHFKTYHMPYQQVLDVIGGVNIDSLKYAYTGVVLNSNYSRNMVGDFTDVDELDFFINEKKLVRKMKHIIRCSELRLRKTTAKKIITKMITGK